MKAGTNRPGSDRPAGKARSGGKTSVAKKSEAPAALSHRAQDISGILLLALAALTVVSLLSAGTGMLGRTLVEGFSIAFGRGAWAVPVAFVALGIALLRGREVKTTTLSWGLVLILAALLGALAAPINDDFFDPAAVSASGGYVGAFVGWTFTTLLGTGKFIGFLSLGLIGGVLCGDMPIRALLAAKRRVQENEPFERGLARPSLTDEDRIRPLKRAVVSLDDDEPVAPVPVSELKDRLAKPQLVIKDLGARGEPTLNHDAPTPKEGYQLPPINLLAEAILTPKRGAAEMQKNIETLEGTLEQFGIEANVVEVATGPTVTRYEIQLGPGVRVARITALADNIAMDLAASQVRVEAPIPGKAAIGVEVPNSAPSMVTLRELCDTAEFRNHPSRLFVGLGKDVSGVNKFADLTKMPHLLIGGATNSGKSIGLATIITSLLMRNTPKDCRLVMIDPKRVELSLFDHIPHLMCPVIKDVKEAPGVLRAVWREMDRRYDTFSEAGVRNIDGWNAKASFQDRMPYIVVVIDELADLMIQAANEVETSIVRLAQLARAVGIHLVIATQRPSVDVITGTIKANVPSRIAFSVASQIDSRTIIDGKGAENLIGKGDMLFLPIDANKPLRVQGCYVSEKEIEAVCKFWREQEKPAYVLDPITDFAAEPAKEGGDFGEDMDPLWEEVVRFVVSRATASTSMIQRKFSIGFQRASRLLDMMEERSIVGPKDGSRPREILIDSMELENIFRPVRDHDHPGAHE